MSLQILSQNVSTHIIQLLRNSLKAPFLLNTEKVFVRDPINGTPKVPSRLFPGYSTRMSLVLRLVLFKEYVSLREKIRRKLLAILFSGNYVDLNKNNVKYSVLYFIYI